MTEPAGLSAALVGSFTGTAEEPLPWEFAESRLAEADYYWLGTTFTDGRPHAVPIWGLWADDRLHCEGRPENAWVANLRKNPSAVVHIPDPEQVVILHGQARILDDDDLSEPEWAHLDRSFQRKYHQEHGSPYIVIVPNRVLAWDGDIQTTTRWTFPQR